MIFLKTIQMVILITWCTNSLNELNTLWLWYIKLYIWFNLLIFDYNGSIFIRYEIIWYILSEIIIWLGIKEHGDILSEIVILLGIKEHGVRGGQNLLLGSFIRKFVGEENICEICNKFDYYIF